MEGDHRCTARSRVAARSEQVVAMTPVMATRTATGVIERLPRSAVTGRRILPSSHSCTGSSTAMRRTSRATWRRTSRSSDARTRARSASPSRPWTAPSTKPATRGRRSRSSRCPSRFAYGLAILDLHGEAAVRRRIGVEPTGEAFNAISAGGRRPGRPFNPMVNAGAIATVGLVPRRRRAGDRARRLAAALRALRGPGARGRRGGLRIGARHRPSEPGDRPPAPEHRVPWTTTRTPSSMPISGSAPCAWTARDLALVAATLANEGVNPLTGERGGVRGVGALDADP